MNTKHVPDLEHCQELDRLCKEKGIEVPETEFIWVKEFPIFLSQDSIVTPDEYKMKLEASSLSEEAKSLIKTFPAPLVNELGEWLGKVSGKDFLNSYLEVMDLFIFQIDKVQMSHNLMTDPDIGISMINYLLAEGIITKL